MFRIKLSTPLPPDLSNWLGDVFPAWLQLPPDAFQNLIPFNGPVSPIQIRYIGNAAELGRSVVFANLRVLLQCISDGRVRCDLGSKFTSESLELLLETTTWPDYDVAAARKLPRPLREEIIGPLDFLKSLAIECDLIQIDRDRIEIQEYGHRLLQGQVNLSLVRCVFEAAFSKVNPRTLTKLAHPWVHEQSGVILWGLSITADKPRSVEELTRYCFVPPVKFFEGMLPILDTYMRVVFLQPLTWFGLMETQIVQAGAASEAGQLYRKTPLFDQFMQFDIERVKPMERPN